MAWIISSSWPSKRWPCRSSVRRDGAEAHPLRLPRRDRANDLHQVAPSCRSALGMGGRSEVRQWSEKVLQRVPRGDRDFFGLGEEGRHFIEVIRQRADGQRRCTSEVECVSGFNQPVAESSARMHRLRRPVGRRALRRPRRRWVKPFLPFRSHCARKCRATSVPQRSGIAWYGMAHDGLAGRSELVLRETCLVMKPPRSDSQAENAGSIPVTRSTRNPAQRPIQ